MSAVRVASDNHLIADQRLGEYNGLHVILRAPAEEREGMVGAGRDSPRLP
jgi:hypothetical protein